MLAAGSCRSQDVSVFVWAHSLLLTASGCSAASPVAVPWVFSWPQFRRVAPKHPIEL